MKNELAYPFDGNAVHQQGGSGLTKFELACIHLMAASVTANDHSSPDWMDEEKANQHAKSAILLANSLFNILTNKGTKTEGVE